MIATIPYKMGNLESVLNMLKRVGAEGVITSDISTIKKADKLILPGVGTFDTGMENLESLGLLDVICGKVFDEKIPVLGICLGMQLLTEKSEEGNARGLCWLKAETKKFKFTDLNAALKIPHMGWNTVSLKKESKLFRGLEGDARFYFVHSYHLVCDNRPDVLAETNYGYDFVSAVERDNILGVQFHPEKSHKFGMMLLKNFAELY